MAPSAASLPRVCSSIVYRSQAARPPRLKATVRGGVSNSYRHIMKAASIVLSLVLSLGTPGRSAEIWHDDFLPREAYEDCTLGEIYFALPQNLFEISYRERVESLIRGSIQFDREKKQIYIPGDGGQASLTVRIVTQSKGELVLNVRSDFESDTTLYTLARTKHGWKVATQP